MTLAKGLVARRRFEQALAPAAAAHSVAEELSGLNPAPDGYGAFRIECDMLWAELEPYSEALARIKSAQISVADDRVELMGALDQQLILDQSRLDGIEAAPAAFFAKQIRAGKKASEGERRKIRIAVGAEERRAAKREALSIVCGDEKPAANGWDDEIIGTEAFVERTAHDPDSIDVESCTVPVLTDECWKSTCDVRGKSAFGALVLNRMEFTIAREGVVAAVPVN